MVSSLNLGSVNQNQHYGVAKQENNLYHVNFRAENDRDVYVPSRPREAQAMPMPRPQAPSNYNQQAMLMRKLQEAEQAQKKEKRKSNLAWLLGIGASAAMIYMAFFRGKEPTKKQTQLLVENVENKQTFDELHMPQELKEAVDKLKTRIQRADALKKKGCDGVGGIMLYGEPGGGKNTFVYALTKYFQELFPGSELVSVDVNRFKGGYVGDTENAILGFIDQIKKKAINNPDKKFVVFLDEFDSIARKAGKDSAEWLESAQNAFKTTLTSMMEIPNVQVVAATNKATKGQPLDQFLDDAILNRFSEKIYVPLPSKEQLMHSFVDHFKKLPQDVVNPELVDINNPMLGKICDYLSSGKEQASFRDFVNILKESKFISEGLDRTSGNPITMQDLIDGVIQKSGSLNWDKAELEAFKRAVGKTK